MLVFAIGGGLGLVVGALIALLAQQVRQARIRAEIDSLRQRTTLADEQALRIQSLETDLATERERCAQLARRQDEMKEGREALERDLASLRESLSGTKAQLAGMQETLAAERRQATEKLQLLDDAKRQLADQFKALAADALKANGEMISQQHREGLDRTIKPLAEKLQLFEKQVQETYEKGAKDRAGLAGEIKQLMLLNQEMSDGAKNLTRALKGDSQTRGQWAEVSLMKILEFAGLRQGSEYRYQEHFATADGNQRPDIIVDLPEGRSIVIDSKLSLVSWTEFVDAEDEVARAARGKVFTAAIRTHIRQLAEKKYQELHGLQTLDFVLMYIPLEAAFIEALNRDTDLYRDALDRNLALVGPSTLLATMRTVSAIWRYDKQEKNALKIAEEAGKMHDKLVGFIEKLDEVGQRLDQATEAWQTAKSRLQTGPGNVMKKAQDIVGLGAKAAKKLGIDNDASKEEDEEDDELTADGDEG